ncbi:MAG TPA: hypothetical protein VG841_14040 [Caulobacterales bacterium]|nr:hypothetical protein [Caulobacterales bacterium]
MLKLATIAGAAALAGALTFAAGAQAQDAPAADAPLTVDIRTCPERLDPAREAEDGGEVDAALSAWNRGGYGALAPHLPALQRVLEHAPACYPEFEQRGDLILAREEDRDASMTLFLLLSPAMKDRSVSLQSEANIYGRASLMLGSYANEMHHFEEGIQWLDRGLALQPANQYLTLEKATALGQLRRYDEQVALLQAEIDNPAVAMTLDRARYQRNLGIALIDANRLDDAETALNESIRLQPDNPRARAELQYIAELRAGRPALTQSMTSVGDTPPPEPK